MNDSAGELFIVSSPSGGGKTTLIRKVLDVLRRQGRKAHFSVSHTTRAPRVGEEQGRDYYFVDRLVFQQMIEQREFLEYAEVHGNLYGTSKVEVESRLAQGWDVFLDIDVQGARQVRASVAHAVKIFVFPPSYVELHRRLVHRRQDSAETIALRLQNARREMREYAEFDYVIINDCVEEAAAALVSVVAAARLRPFRLRAAVESILADFDRALKEE